MELPDGSWQGAAQEAAVINGEIMFRCPRRPIKDDPKFWSELFVLFKAFKAGFLPDEGAIAQQSNRGWRFIALLDSAVSKAEAQRMENLKNSR